MFIYLIVNHETGKYYVGQHKGDNLKKYLQTKFSHARHDRDKGHSYLYNSMRKHPFPHLWSIHALRSDIKTREELDQTEKDFIKFLRSQDPEFGYNICRGGEGFTGLSREYCEELSASQKERWKQPDFREKTTAAIRDFHKTKEYRNNASNAAQGRVMSIACRMKMSIAKSKPRPHLRKEFCKYGHDTNICGRYPDSGCKECHRIRLATERLKKTGAHARMMGKGEVRCQGRGCEGHPRSGEAVLGGEGRDCQAGR